MVVVFSWVQSAAWRFWLVVYGDEAMMEFIKHLQPGFPAIFQGVHDGIDAGSLVVPVRDPSDQYIIHNFLSTDTTKTLVSAQDCPLKD